MPISVSQGAVSIQSRVGRRLNWSVIRDVKYRGRDIEGCIKQWFAFVKPNYQKWVAPQRNVADIIIPRGIENLVAIGRTKCGLLRF
jgi:uridine kinase